VILVNCNSYLCIKLVIKQPDMAKIKGAVKVDAERCKGCAVCVAACPFDVLALSKEVNSKGYPWATGLHPDACTGCANCAVVCPDSCITVYRVKSEK
jgi:2-oxoglutarate ferredoxin oxidoreductase subunit delta